MNIKFNYVNAKGEKKARNVIVVHDGDGKIAGFDLKALNRSEAAKVRKVFGKKPVTPFPTEKRPMDYAAIGIPKEVFVRSYRTFNKSDIQ